MKKTLLLIVFLFVCLTAAGCGPALVVDSAGDEPDSNLSDGVCKTVNNDCTLRAAIMEANVSDDISKITFDSNLTIIPSNNLPPLTSNNIQIRGEGQAIILDGSQDTEYPQSGIQILDSHNNIIQGLKIRNFLYGIHILSDAGEAKNNTIGMSPSSTNGSDEHNVLVYNYIGLMIEGQHANNNVVSGNYIGVDSDGVTSKPNEYDGLQIREGAHHNLIGSLTGDTVAEGGNLVSGNDGVGIKLDDSSHHNHISGNYIGTQESGNAELSNGEGIKIIRGCNNNTIGIALSGEGQPNLISGNNSDGISMHEADFNIIAGNFIGVNSTGDSAIPNRFGIYMNLSSQNIIGTDGDGYNDANEGNLISGNNQSGIAIFHHNSIYNVIAGNKIGTNFDGSTSIGNASVGISTSGDSTIIGTNGDGISDGLEGNLITGNNQAIVIDSTGNRISGNIIGLDITGTTDITQIGGGISISSDSSQNLVGTDGDGQSDDLERNIISGLGGSFTAAIAISGSDNLVAGNYIGTDITGSVSLGDTQDGVRLRSTANNNLIGTDGDGIADQAEGNLISGNGRFGIDIQGGAFNTIAGNMIGTDINGTTALPNGYTNPQYYYGTVRLGSGSNNNVIGTDGDGMNDQIEGNLISGNAIKGIVILGSNIFNNVVAGNKIGTDISGGSVLGNTAGIEVMQGAEYTRIGTNGDGLSDPAEANIISGNGDFGIRIDSPGNVIQGNYIGTDLTGTSDLGNGTHGILINNNALGVGIGGSLEKANTIAFNKRAGIYVRKIYPNDPNDPNNVIITFNSIYSNAEEGIDLDDATQTGSTPNDSGDVDTGPNDFMNYPELNYAQSITPTLTITGEIIDGLPNTQNPVFQQSCVRQSFKSRRREKLSRF